MVSGYAGGITDNPTYESLHSGDTGHAECVQITFDPKVISFGQLLEVFYYTHDPTTPNRQGNDVGPQFRSAIFYQGDKQKKIAQEVTKNFAHRLWDNPVVTEILPLRKFWPAEEQHQDFFNRNPENTYCQLVINPKLQKFRSKFEQLLR